MRLSFGYLEPDELARGRAAAAAAIARVRARAPRAAAVPV